MYMTKDEIVVRYKQAKNQNEQVKILAELNACTTTDILDILSEAEAITGIKKKHIKQYKSGNDEFDNDIVKFFNEGLMPVEIAERLGVDECFISRRVKKLKESGEIEIKNKIDTRAEVRKLYEEGLALSEIARKLNKGKSTIKYHIDKIKDTEKAKERSVVKRDDIIAGSKRDITIGFIVDGICNEHMLISSKESIVFPDISEEGLSWLYSTIKKTNRMKLDINENGYITVTILGGKW